MTVKYLILCKRIYFKDNKCFCEFFQRSSKNVRQVGVFSVNLKFQPIRIPPFYKTYFDLKYCIFFLIITVLELIIPFFNIAVGFT